MLPVSFIRGMQSPSTAVIDPSIARQVLAMLETVTGPDGTATRASVSGYRVAGKTGTSRKASGGSYQRNYLSVFAGLVPVSAPRFAMVVVIDDPQSGDYYGGLVAAPVFQRVMEGSLRLLDVTPDRVDQWIAGANPTPAALPGAGGLPPEAEPVLEHIADGAVQ
jgi:cell division protein FtsI (penicillin-binding protein 3)